MKYSLSDYDLIVKARQGDHFCYTTLYVRYYRYSISLVKSELFLNNHCYLSEDELVITCMECFSKCFEYYMGGSNSFYPYWKKSALHAIKKEMKENHEYYQINETSFDEEDFYGRLNNEKYGIYDEDIKINITSQEINKIIESNAPKFTKMEKKVFIRKYRRGNSTLEVSRDIGISISSVNKHYKNALDKFTTFMKEHY